MVRTTPLGLSSAAAMSAATYNRTAEAVLSEPRMVRRTSARELRDIAAEDKEARTPLAETTRLAEQAVASRTTGT